MGEIFGFALEDRLTRLGGKASQGWTGSWGNRSCCTVEIGMLPRGPLQRVGFGKPCRKHLKGATDATPQAAS